MSAVENLLVGDASDEGIRSVALVGASCDLLSGDDERDGNKGDYDVNEEQQSGDETREHVFMTQKVDLMVHLEEDADSVLDECGDEKDSTKHGEIGGGYLAGATCAGYEGAGRRGKIG